MTSEQARTRRPGVVAFAPALFLFIGIYTHVLLLLFVGFLFAMALVKDTRVNRIWGAAAIAVALIAGIALWQPTPLVVPR